MLTMKTLLPLFAIAGMSLQLTAEDWPRWRGPHLDGISRETAWTAEWPRSGPKVLWRANVGTGFSSFSVADGRVYTLGNDKDKDTVFCFDAESGKELWKHTYPESLDPKYYEGGPSSTPTVDGDVVYTLSRKGVMFAFDAATGTVRWTTNVAEETGAKIPTWGFAGSVLVHGDKLVVNIGEHGTAVDPKNGEILWKTGTAEAGYSTPLPFQIGDQKGLALFAAKGMAAVNPDNGRLLWKHPWETSYDVNAADPIFQGNRVFISSGYNTGGGLIEVDGDKTRQVWANRNMHNQFNSSVLIDGYLYGITGQDGKPGSGIVCVEFATGKQMWKNEEPAFGALSAAGDTLIVLGEKGVLITAEASPKEFKVISRAQVLGGKCWTTPVLSNGKIFVRNARGNIACVDVGR